MIDAATSTEGRADVRPPAAFYFRTRYASDDPVDPFPDKHFQEFDGDSLKLFTLISQQKPEEEIQLEAKRVLDKYMWNEEARFGLFHPYDFKKWQPNLRLGSIVHWEWKGWDKFSAGDAFHWLFGVVDAANASSLKSRIAKLSAAIKEYLENRGIETPPVLTKPTAPPKRPSDKAFRSFVMRSTGISANETAERHYGDKKK